MGRKQKSLEEKKIKVSISLDRELYSLIKQDKIMPSRIIEKFLQLYLHIKFDKQFTEIKEIFNL